MTIETLLSSLSTREKLDAMNFLWRDLTQSASTYVSPEWHGEILAQRMANPSSAPRLPLDAAIQDVKERLNARRAEG